MLPDKTTKCHRTGFQQTCFTCVTEHGCRLWKRVTLENHPETKTPVDHYDCVDSLVDLYMKDMLRRQLQTTATVDKVAATVQQANDQRVVGAIARLNRQMDETRQAAIANGAGPAPLLIEQD